MNDSNDAHPLRILVQIRRLWKNQENSSTQSMTYKRYFVESPHIDVVKGYTTGALILC